MAINVKDFNAAEYLDTAEVAAEYLKAVLAESDPQLTVAAVADIVRSRGFSSVAKDAKVGRNSLYKSLAEGAEPKFETIFKICRALGLQLSVTPIGNIETTKAQIKAPAIKRNIKVAASTHPKALVLTRKPALPKGDENTVSAKSRSTSRQSKVVKRSSRDIVGAN